ncbi:MAG: replication-associated recombination protein A [Oscillospiraceae bacterium]|nr:replication-associated recombination protein A [Oscillospiraceae bacterium]
MRSPLADRIRPKSLDDIVGQKHLLGEGKALRNIIESGELPNLIFYGPSGTGKTTLASIIALQTNRKFHKLNGTSASTADIKAIVAELDTLAAPNGILLYLDEIQYFNKKQQQTLLDYIERGEITLVASTTENPYFYIHGAILSRSTVFEFKSVAPEEIVPALKRAFAILSEEKQMQIEANDEVLLYMARACAGDVRKALNSAELCVLSTLPDSEGKLSITKEKAMELTQKSAMKYDREGDEHYDILSAFQKSMRGSDPNAALHYLARLLEAGDLPSAVRRLMVCACEDVGLAYPMIIPIVKSAVDAALMVGLPEARIPLADAVVLVCNSPKSNSAYLAYDEAAADLRAGKSGPIPRQLQNKHFDGEDNQNKGQFYRYPHDYPGHYVPQQYLPDVLKNKVYYRYGENKTEQAAKEYWQRIKQNDDKK